MTKHVVHLSLVLVLLLLIFYPKLNSSEMSDPFRCDVKKFPYIGSSLSGCEKIRVRRQASTMRRRGKRRKRFQEKKLNENISFDAMGYHYNLPLAKFQFRTSRNFVALVREANETDVKAYSPENTCLSYDASPGKSAVFNSCKEMIGVVTNNEDQFVVLPDKNARSSETEATAHVHTDHVVLKLQSDLILRETTNTLLETLAVLSSVMQKPVGNENQRKFDVSTKERRKKSTESYVIEVAVFVDKFLTLKLGDVFGTEPEEQIVNMVMAMLSSVNILFSSLEEKIEIVVKRVEIFKESPKDLESSPNIDTYLTNFCKWQSEENSPREELHWDYAMLLTGLDLQSTSKDGNVSSKVVGLAPISGMCDPASSCSVIEGQTFESIFVMAHELGHNLGMLHDGVADLNDCDPGGFLMSPTLSGTKNTWSSCSNNYLKKFLTSPHSLCLSDGENKDQEKKFPGETFPADIQCQLRYGHQSQHSRSQNMSDLCRDLHCVRDHFTWTSHPALEGTSCGNNQWCRHGECLLKDVTPSTNSTPKSASSLAKRIFPSPKMFPVSQSTSSPWTEWSSPSKCSPTCYSGRNRDFEWLGLRVSSRKCRARRKLVTENEEFCTGATHRYQLCFAQKDCPKFSDPSAALKEFVGSICEEASLRTRGDVSPLGRVELNDDSCQVKCFTPQSSQTIQLGRSLPDGTKCGAPDKEKFCVRGKCQEFACDTETRFQMNEEACNLRAATSTAVEKWSSWTEISTCRHSCLLPSHGIRFVYRQCLSTLCRGLERSIQTCQDQESASRCTQYVTTTQYATDFCHQYKSQHLSGYGGQLKPSPEDPDRPCKVACQDRLIEHRFYVVGQFPTGTTCGDKGLCIQGKCLELDADGTPLYHTPLIREEFGNFWSLKKRKKRELVVEPPVRIPGSIDQQLLAQILDELNRTNFEFEKSEDFRNFVENPIDLDQAYVDRLETVHVSHANCLSPLSVLLSLFSFILFLRSLKMYKMF